MDKASCYAPVVIIVPVDIDVDGFTPLLRVLRQQPGLTVTSFSCVIGLCGTNS